MSNIVLSTGKMVSIEELGLKRKKSLAEALKGIKVIDKMGKVLIVLLDGSGSMLDSLEGTSKIKVAWNTLKSELMPNMAGWAYGVLVFHGFNNIDWIVYPGQGTMALMGSVPQADGDTPMGGALTMAWQWVRSYATQARFILLSDGLPTDMSKHDIMQDAETHKSIPIDTVGIGEGFYSYDPVFLAALSNITGGMFVKAASVKLLAEAILRLAPTNRPLLGVVKE